MASRIDDDDSSYRSGADAPAVTSPRGAADPQPDPAAGRPADQAPTEEALAEEEEEARADAARGGTIRQAWAGLAPSRRRFVLVGVALGVVSTAIIIWFALAATWSKPTWQDVAFQVVDDHHVTTRFEVSKPRDMTVECTVIAQDMKHAVVGRTVVTLPPSQTRSTVREVTLRTTSRAVNGTVRRCHEK